MEYKITVSRLDSQTGRHVHFFTAENITAESKAHIVQLHLKRLFKEPEFQVSSIYRWQTTGIALEDLG